MTESTTRLTTAALEDAVMDAAYGSAVRATWEPQPNSAAGRPDWVRRADSVAHAGDPFGRFLVWLHNTGHRRLAARGIHTWVTQVCHLTGEDPTSAAARSETYFGILVAASSDDSPIDSMAAVAALDAEGAY